ncbi:7447_t:CDS:2, partial [Funneliformis geosporum]
EKRNNLIKQRAAPNIDFDFGTRTVKPYRAEKISYRANERAEDISVTCRGRDKGQMFQNILGYPLELTIGRINVSRKYLKKKNAPSCIRADALNSIHKDDIIHKDLHSGNILYLQYNNYWYISDLGFCGPADMPSGSIYGNLPYIAPEVITGKAYTKASDIYSVGMLMWELASGQPPFNDYENDYDLAIKIINGMRPKIVSNIPIEYKKLMEECWDADPSNRPDIGDLHNKINEINKGYDQKLNGNKSIIKKFFQNFQSNHPRTDDDLEIDESCNIEIILRADNCSNSSAKNNSSAKSGSIFEVNNNKSSKRLSRVFKKLRMNISNTNINNSDEAIHHQSKEHSIENSDDDDNPNLHLKVQKDHLEIRNRLEVPDVNVSKSYDV